MKRKRDFDTLCFYELNIIKLLTNTKFFKQTEQNVYKYSWNNLYPRYSKHANTREFHYKIIQLIVNWILTLQT